MFYRNITKFCRSIHFALVTQINLQQLFIPCALLHLSFKAEIPTNGFQDISFLVLKSIQA